MTTRKKKPTTTKTEQPTTTGALAEKPIVLPELTVLPAAGSTQGKSRAQIAPFRPPVEPPSILEPFLKAVEAEAKQEKMRRMAILLPDGTCVIGLFYACKIDPADAKQTRQITSLLTRRGFQVY